MNADYIVKTLLSTDGEIWIDDEMWTNANVHTLAIEYDISNEEAAQVIADMLIENDYASHTSLSDCEIYGADKE